MAEGKIHSLNPFCLLSFHLKIKMWVFPIMSADPLYLNQGILKENFSSLWAAHSISLLLLTGTSNEGLKIDPFIF